jgi:hypothetical protein
LCTCVCGQMCEIINWVIFWILNICAVSFLVSLMLIDDCDFVRVKLDFVYSNYCTRTRAHTLTSTNAIFYVLWLNFADLRIKFIFILFYETKPDVVQHNSFRLEILSPACLILNIKTFSTLLIWMPFEFFGYSHTTYARYVQIHIFWCILRKHLFRNITIDIQRQHTQYN